MIQNDTKIRSKSDAFRNDLFYANPTFYLGKTYDSEDRGIDFRSKIDKKTIGNLLTFLDAIWIDFWTISAPKLGSIWGPEGAQEAVPEPMDRMSKIVTPSMRNICFWGSRPSKMGPKIEQKSIENQTRK